MLDKPHTKASVLLPTADRKIERYALSAPKSFPDRVTRPLNLSLIHI